VAKRTGIQWCDHTFSPWWGCVKVSEGCNGCYAQALDHRLGGEHWGPESERRFFGDKHWNEPRRWNLAASKAGVRRRVFCSSMADVFERRPDLIAPRARLWRLIADTPYLDWLLLTKRPENFDLLPWGSWPASSEPWLNVWLGATAENQRRADERIPRLIETPAVMRFVSYEPALGPLRIHPAWMDTCSSGRLALHWLIAGSESGPGARDANLDWYRDVRDQCARAGIAFFLKQHARRGIKIPLPELDGRRHVAFPEARP
jgi:protein gp37